MSNKLAVVRVRGTVKVRKDIADTLSMLNLSKPHQVILCDDRPAYLGMLDKAKDYITYGEVEPEIIETLLLKWGRTAGNDRLTEAYVKEKTGQTIKQFIKTFMKSEKDLDELEIKKVFRLHPPRKGYRSIKRAFSQGGDAGYRGSEINALLRRMM